MVIINLYQHHCQNFSSLSLAETSFLIPMFRRLSRHQHQRMEDTQSVYPPFPDDDAWIGVEMSESKKDD